MRRLPRRSPASPGDVPVANLSRLRKFSGRASGFAPRPWPGAPSVSIEAIIFPSARKDRPAAARAGFWAPLESLLQERNGDAGMLRLRQLVLQAKALPYLLERGALYVPLFTREVAAGEIRAFENERRYADYLERLEPEYSKKDNWIRVIMLLALLAFWNSLRYRAREWNLDFLPYNSEGWVEVGALNKFALGSGEWWRCFTALTLHADAEHLLSNILFGAIFLLLLCRRTGLGLGAFITVFSAAAANACNSLFQAPQTLSIGFSTAVFAALGALCGLAALRILTGAGAGKEASGGLEQNLTAHLAAHIARRERRGIFLSLAAGVAFLSFIGGSGAPRVDFSAHALGFAAGAAFVFLPGFLARALAGPRSAARFYGLVNGGLGLRAQAFLLAGTFFTLALAWHRAFAMYWK